MRKCKQKEPCELERPSLVVLRSWCVPGNHQGAFFFFNHLAVQHSMWDLSSPTRDRTCACWQYGVLTTGPWGKSHQGACLNVHSQCHCPRDLSKQDGNRVLGFSFFQKKNCGLKNNIKLTISTDFLSVQFSSAKYIHFVVQQIYRAWSPAFCFPSPQPLTTSFLFSLFMNLTSFHTSYKCNHTTFLFLWLAYFI